MEIFAPGQRWINNAQLDKGLGTVLSSDARSVTLLFLATGETNIYSLQSAPLSRVKFDIGDTILSHDDQTILVSSVTEKDHLFTYVGKVVGKTVGNDESGSSVELEETLLNNFIQLNQPTERLFNDQIDDEKWFELRAQTLYHLNDLAHSKLRGLTGGRTSLISHQLYIAHEVASRYAPRVLLADEVGLGKTIEAGMILHQQLITERAQRALIVVPESLVHQWLVEMLRRFNLMFHIMDEERCADILVSGEAENPFQSEQLILCSQEFLTRSVEHFQQCLASDWDLLVVDEAHHLVWSEQQPSKEYQVIEQLAAQTKGVLLLTATPEQLGKESHFARLRLLDADRFPDFDSFIEEEKSYEPIAHTLEQLIEQQVADDSFTLDNAALETLNRFADEGDNQENIRLLQKPDSSEAAKESARKDLIEHLLDRHGTGRVLFRNTRTAVKGFPGRQAIPHALELPKEYTDFRTELYPELLVGPSWVAHDPRLLWLIDFIKSQGENKTLIIAANAQTALDIADVLRIKEAIHAGVFHENMSLVERDRAAAFFADKQDGTPVLICSEIGSEGRNFQFAHQMVLFDLPLNPDLLEQRIGRLDRIGQTETIQIHIPYLKGTAQAVLFQWIHEGLQAFELTCPAAHTLFKQQKDKLLAALQTPEKEISSLIKETKVALKEHNEALHKGRDRLLEYNSCRPHLASAIYQQALELDQTSKLADYMDDIYDCYGINSEDDRENTLIIRPSDHMLTAFPGLPDDGMTITYDRDTALSNEDLHFLSWDHPLVREALDLVITSEMGNTSFTAIEHDDFQPGSILVEAMYVLDASANKALQSHRYLPPTTLRLVVDESGEDYSELLDTQSIQNCRTQVDRKTASQIVKMKQDEIRDLIKRCEFLAMQETPVVLALAHQQSKHLLESEINRLTALQSVNPNIRDEEISFFKDQLTAINMALEAAHLRLDAVRIIVTT
ncbi:MAG: RNA polymerase-associated protein RapA [Thiotrichaceae bacterium]